MAAPIKTAVLAVYLLQHVAPSKTSPRSDIGLNTVQLIENHGYLSESHIITTEDGYILTYHRIPHGKNNGNVGKKPVVLLMHGIVCSSADFVNMGAERSLGYILADQGYDVWMANARGNAWSRNHTKYDPIKDAKKFFDFSWHEIGYYDLPAAIDYILNVTGQDSLFYVGHSQGGTVFLVFASTRPEYNKKIKLSSLMAPPTFMENMSNRIILGLAKNMNQLEKLTARLQIYELPFLDEIRKVGVTLCPLPAVSPFCEAIYFAMVGPDPPQFDQRKFPVILSNFPSNSAMKQVFHFNQLTKNGGFSQFDYGRDKNLKIYNSEKPPHYNLSQVTTPVALYYARSDVLVNLKDVRKLLSKLPNVVEEYLVPYSLFSHMDFMYAKDAPKLLYNELIEVMNKYEIKH